jgi:predicted dehydrogenase
MQAGSLPTMGESSALRVLHVGVSNRGRWPLEHCADLAGFTSAALCDVSEEALERARELTGLEASACFTDLDTALAQAEVDCVIICAPTVFHVPFVKKAIDAGLPALTEKGMAPTWREAHELVAYAEAKGGRFCVAQNYRFNPVERRLHAMATDPDHPRYLGRIYLANYIQNRCRPEPRTLTYPYASVWDMSCHHFDNLLFWLGPVADMQARAFAAPWSAYEHPNNTAATLRFQSGATAHYLHTHDAAAPRLLIELHGENGAAIVEEEAVFFSPPPARNFETPPRTPLEVPPTGRESDLLRAFHAFITEGTDTGISARGNLETMALCQMCVLACEEQRLVRREELD